MSKTAIIIGGGIAGCSSAYALASRGVQVTMLERNANIASEASGNPLAMLYPRLSGDDSMSQLALAGYLYSLKLFKTLDLSPADFHQCGMLQLGFNGRELKRIQKVASQNYSSDILRLVTKQEASLIAGIEIEHDALYFPQAAWVNPKQLCSRLTQHANISVITSIQVTSLEPAIEATDSSLNKQSTAGKLTATANLKFKVKDSHDFSAIADTVIIANANDAQTLYPELKLNTVAVCGQVSLLKPTPESSSLKTIVCSDGYFSPASRMQNSTLSHCLGATFTTEPCSITKYQALQADVKNHLANLDKLSNISPRLRQELQHNIAGGRVSLRCATSDYLPLVGQLLDSHALIAAPPRPSANADSLPWLAGLYMNVAHGSKGFTTAPLCAELLACMVSNEPLPTSNELAGLLNPNRFLLRQMGLKRLAKTVVGETCLG